MRLDQGSIGGARVLRLRALDLTCDSASIPRPVLEDLARVCRVEGRDTEAASYASRSEE